MQHTEQVMRWLAPFFGFVLCLIAKRSKLEVSKWGKEQAMGVLVF